MPEVHQLEPLELAWAAGFFDGEGTTCNTKTYGMSTRLSVPQKEPECLQRFQRALGDVGTIYGPITSYPNRTIYRYTIQTVRDVDTALTNMWPFLSIHKRQQAERTGFQFGVIRNPKTGRPKGSKSRPKEVK